MCLELQKRGFLCWYDNQMAKLTREAMADGVQGSCFVVLSPMQPPQRSGGGTTKSPEEALEELWRLCVKTVAFQKGFRQFTIAKPVTSRREPNP